jgi:glycosyltransferase involved in cell wall biosynthesis
MALEKYDLHCPEKMSNAGISVLIFTLNEELHLRLCLASLTWCDDIIVVDSFSTDGTKDICLKAGVRFFEHPFEGFGRQRNWALDNTAPKYNWILILDADERVTPELAEEMAGLVSEDPPFVGAFRVKRRFHMWGRWLRYSSLYPTWVVRLVHKDRVRYINRGHAETQEVRGEIRELQNDLIDENLKGIDEWFERQNRYATKDAEYELSLETSSFKLGHMFTADPLERRAAMKRLAMRMPGRALWYFLYSYIIRRGFLDGKEGLYFCIMKAMYQQMVDIKKFNMRTGNKR